MENNYIQYGCGLSAPKEWINFDASPTLRLQKLGLPTPVKFPANVRYGDIVKGLPVADNSADGVYCSHILEHLALEDCRTALRNTIRIMKPGALFRCVVPDLEAFSRDYLRRLDSGEDSASLAYITMMGENRRPSTVRERIADMLGNDRHRWMWDRKSLAFELRQVGFSDVRECKFNDSANPMFKYVEEESRFAGAVALEGSK